MHAGGEAGKFEFAVGVGVGLKIELVESAKAVGDVDLHVGGENGLALLRENSEQERTGADAAVDGRNLWRRLRRGWWLLGLSGRYGDDCEECGTGQTMGEPVHG